MTVGHNKTRQHRTSGRNGEKMVSRHKGSKEGGVPRKEGGESKEGRGRGSKEGGFQEGKGGGCKEEKEFLRVSMGFQWFSEVLGFRFWVWAFGCGFRAPSGKTFFESWAGGPGWS